MDDIIPKFAIRNGTGRWVGHFPRVYDSQGVKTYGKWKKRLWYTEKDAQEYIRDHCSEGAVIVKID
jgi:hypothetical protein